MFTPRVCHPRVIVGRVGVAVQDMRGRDGLPDHHRPPHDASAHHLHLLLHVPGAILLVHQHLRALCCATATTFFQWNRTSSLLCNRYQCVSME